MPRLWIVLGTFTVATGAAWSGAAIAQDESAFRIAMMARCATIGDKGARLACYDAAQRGGPIALPAPAASGVAPAAAGLPSASTAPGYAPSAAASGNGFGFGASRDPRRFDSGQSRITARAVAATDDGRGYWTIKLDNGATWRMVELDSMFRPPSRNESVRIRKGAMGGYLMDVDRQQAVRVERVD